MKQDQKNKNLLAWDDGELTRTIVDGETATFNTGYFSSSKDTWIKLIVNLNDQTTGKLVKNVVSKSVEVNSLTGLGYQTITLDSNDYQKPGKYLVLVGLSDQEETEKDSTTLLLIVKEKPQKANTKPYVFMSWTGQSITQKDRLAILKEPVQFAYVATSEDKQVDLKIDLLKDNSLVQNLVSKTAVDSFLAQLSGSETLNLGVGKYVVKATATDKDKDVSTYSLNLEVKAKSIDPKKPVYKGPLNPPKVKIPKTHPGPLKPAFNQSPTISLSSSTVSVEEGKSVSIKVTAQDKDSKNLKLRAYFKYNLFGWVIPIEFKALWGATFVDNGDNTGTYTFAPDYNFVIHPLTQKVTDLYVAASDGDKTTTDAEAKVTVTVKDDNRNPTFVDSAKTKKATVGEKLEIEVEATDLDKEDQSSLKLTPVSDHVGAKFTDDSNGKGKWQWTPTKAGTISVTFKVTDQMGGFATKEVLVTVSAAPVKPNTAPVLDPIKNQKVKAGEPLKFTVKATDAEGHNITLKYWNLPNGASFKDNGDGTGTFIWTPTKDQVKKHKVVFQAEDKWAEGKAQSVWILVWDEAKTTPKNHKPILGEIKDQEVYVGDKIQFGVTATDEDNDSLEINIDELPAANAEFTAWGSEGKSGGTFTWTPKTVTTKKITFDIENIPIGAIFNTVLGEFTWTPGDHAVDTDYEVTFTVTDGELTDSKTVKLTVKAKPTPKPDPKPKPTPVNNGPGFEDIDDKTVTAGQKLQFTVKAVDLDNDKLTLTTANLPNGAAFKDNGDGTGTFTWIPTASQVKVHKDITFKVTDGTDSDVEIIKIEVLRANSAPKIVSSPITTASQGKEYKYAVKVVDAEQDPVKYEVLSGPSGGMSFKNNVLSWTPKSSSKACAMIKVTETNTLQKLSDTQGFCVSVEKSFQELKFVTVNLWSEQVLAGDYARINVGVANSGDKDMEDLKITAVIYDLGVKRSTGYFDLDEGDSLQKQLVLDIPSDAQAGDYYVRVTVSGDETTHVAHRVFSVN